LEAELDRLKVYGNNVCSLKIFWLIVCFTS